MAWCEICKEDVNGPCTSTAQAIDGGCISPPRKQAKQCDPELAKRVASQIKGCHSMSSGSGSWEG